MERFRKVCVILFGSLSVLFALVAIHNHYFLNSSKRYAHNAYKWDSTLEDIAQEQNKLIFFFVSGEEVVSKRILKSLKNNYIYTVLDKQKNPADYTVFNYFLKRTSKTKKDLACAILTPSLKPIYLSSKSDKRRLEKLLPTLASTWENNQKLIQNRANAISNRQVFLAQHHYIANAQMLGLNNEYNPDNYNAKLPTAVLTENARLIFKRLKSSNAPHLIYKANVAIKHLKDRFKSEKSYTSKLLIARAIADVSFAISPRNTREVQFIADEIVNFSKNKISHSNIKALELAVLCRAYKIYDNTQYLDCAEQIAKEIQQSINASENISAIIPIQQFNVQFISQTSIASAFDLSTMANALCDYFEITGEKDAINTALVIIRKLDSDYTHNGVWTMNSKFSASAKFARITITKDSTTPSHIGEAYQAISRLKRTLQIPTISPVEQKIRTITKSFIPSAEQEHASIKLAEID